MNNRQGSAYIFVLVAALLITLLAGIALTITVASRRVTASYSDFSSLYNLAVGGNERVLFFTREFLAGYDAPTIQDLHNAALAFAPLGWDLTVEITQQDDTTRIDTYRFLTTVMPLTDRVRVQTRVYRIAAITVPATINAYLKLDGSSVAMVHSIRITP
ncbi:MAG: hypothetical protein FWC16_09325 [Defluviitaleaceae bacterium]|nr:hypothetical protein [Defluviitaleaceae bacterium]MCL2275112.1 hypothetical protein [Defluviitaleaceae bacterium]